MLGSMVIADDRMAKITPFSALLTNCLISQRSLLKKCLHPLKYVALLTLFLYGNAESISWTVIQVTSFGQGEEEGVVSPDINDEGEIVYGFRPSNNDPSQVFSTVRGQLTLPTDFFAADIGRINNLGEVVVRGCASQTSCNFLVLRLDSSIVDFGVSIPTVHNIDHNDLGEVIALSVLEGDSEASIISSKRDVLLDVGSNLSTTIGLSNSGQIAIHKPPTPSISGLPADAFNFSINDHDEVVFLTTNSIMLWDGSAFHTVVASTSPFDSGPRMNNHRQVVFAKRDVNNIRQIYLATPQDADGDGILDDDDNCPDIANADQSDFDQDNIGDDCDPDDDNDNVLDEHDVCPKSDFSETVVIGECDSGVTNQLLVDGCTISDLVNLCAEGTSSHGDFGSCVTDVTNDLKTDRIITGKEKGTIQTCVQ